MAKQPKGFRDYLAAIGAKGGKVKGPAKARSPELYKRLADMKKAKAAKRKREGK